MPAHPSLLAAQKTGAFSGLSDDMSVGSAGSESDAGSVASFGSAGSGVSAGSGGKQSKKRRRPKKRRKKTSKLRGMLCSASVVCA